MKARAALFTIFVTASCSNSNDLERGSADRTADTPPPGTPRIIADSVNLDLPQARLYLSRLAPMLVGRVLDKSENEQLDARAEGAVRGIVEGWTKSKDFAESFRALVQHKLRASGSKDGIDFELPGNLAAYIATNDLPFSELLTADYCVNESLAKTDCDTGAPYAAGVLATRAFLAKNASRFNLHRASVMMQSFACETYPMSTKLQPPLEKAALIPMFRADNAEEQTAEEAKGGFGNGSGCYGCHSQFGAHAQTFVKFDETGLWISDATGLQMPGGEPGRSARGLFTSHMNDSGAAASEETQFFGKRAKTLRDVALTLAQSDAFLACGVRGMMDHGMALGSQLSSQIDAALVDEIVKTLRSDGEPTVSRLALEVFSHPRVIRGFVAGGSGR